jgi:hypothetical protein
VSFFSLRQCASVSAKTSVPLPIKRLFLRISRNRETICWICECIPSTALGGAPGSERNMMAAPRTNVSCPSSGFRSVDFTMREQKPPVEVPDAHLPMRASAQQGRCGRATSNRPSCEKCGREQILAVRHSAAIAVRGLPEQQHLPESMAPGDACSEFLEQDAALSLPQSPRPPFTFSEPMQDMGLASPLDFPFFPEQQEAMPLPSVLFAI